MDILPDPQFWGRLLEISFLNLLLSGDNAVVIALAVRALPRRKRLLGQIWGTVGAVVLRLLFVGIVTALLQIPFLRLIGALLLLWIAVRLVRPNEEAESAGRHGTSFWESVWIIIVADVTMSLDNVLAVAAAAHGNMAPHRHRHRDVHPHRRRRERAPRKPHEPVCLDHLGRRGNPGLRGG